jgi:CheY-like chemotaxis protein
VHRILLAEDNELTREMLRRWLERRGYEVCPASDGGQALSIAREDPPALVLMDMGMPGMDGWETARRFKEDPELRDIPIIALTAYAMEGDREKALAAGCDEYQSKPFDFAELLNKIRVLLHEMAPAD